MGTSAQSDSSARSLPVQLLTQFPSPIVQVAASKKTSQASAVLLADGTVWTTGAYEYGQLGDGSSSSRSTWSKVPGLSGVTQIASGALTFYALAGGKIWAWGDNWFGTVGDGTTRNQRNTPVQVSGITTATQVAAGAQQAYALLSDGSLKGWGRGDAGFGAGATADQGTPIT
ncbi:RCC1 domain-containing protein, partial [Flavobacterium myungsuense]|uniref:RCC1 domain-containing protein n=1 Tax=Flavobacterium myungsuense TaxID=651823 RepID=UPI0036D36BE2